VVFKGNISTINNIKKGTNNSLPINSFLKNRMFKVLKKMKENIIIAMINPMRPSSADICM
jgi:hypothetical protein